MTNEEKRKLLEDKLKTRFFIVAAGAWQDQWDQQDIKQIGFDSVKTEQKSLCVESLRQSISAELLRRFRHEIAILPPMTRDDYLAAQSKLVKSLPGELTGDFMTISSAGIKKACNDHLGMRFFEECLTRCMIKNKDYLNKLDKKQEQGNLLDERGLAHQNEY